MRVSSKSFQRKQGSCCQALSSSLSSGLNSSCNLYISQRLSPAYSSKWIMCTIAAQGGRGQVKTIHTTSFLRPSAGGVKLPVGINMCVDRFLTRCHGLREHGVHIAIRGTGLEHRSPVDLTGMIGVGTRHHGALAGILHDGRIYLFTRLACLKVI